MSRPLRLPCAIPFLLSMDPGPEEQRNILRVVGDTSMAVQTLRDLGRLVEAEARADGVWFHVTNSEERYVLRCPAFLACLEQSNAHECIPRLPTFCREEYAIAGGRSICEGCGAPLRPYLVAREFSRDELFNLLMRFALDGLPHEAARRDVLEFMRKLEYSPLPTAEDFD